VWACSKTTWAILSLKHTISCGWSALVQKHAGRRWSRLNKFDFWKGSRWWHRWRVRVACGTHKDHSSGTSVGLPTGVRRVPTQTNQNKRCICYVPIANLIVNQILISLYWYYISWIGSKFALADSYCWLRRRKGLPWVCAVEPFRVGHWAGTREREREREARESAREREREWEILGHLSWVSQDEDKIGLKCKIYIMQSGQQTGVVRPKGQRTRLLYLCPHTTIFVSSFCLSSYTTTKQVWNHKEGRSTSVQQTQVGSNV